MSIIKFTEQWIPIYKIDPLYEISNLARVRSWKGQNQYSKKRKIPKLLKTHLSYQNRTYASFYIPSLKKKKKIRISILVAEAFVPNPENKPFVNHIDGNKLNDLPYNLEWVTLEEHWKHTTKNNLHCQGSQIGTSKLTEKEVLLIRTLPPLGIRANEIANAFNIHKSTVYEIINEKTWVHLL